LPALERGCGLLLRHHCACQHVGTTVTETSDNLRKM
jgi:hypothetical protein